MADDHGSSHVYVYCMSVTCTTAFPFNTGRIDVCTLLRASATGVSADERLDTRPCEARTVARGPRLPAASRLDGDHVLLLRLSEVVRIRGAGPDSLYRKRSADLLAVSPIRCPWSELVSGRGGMGLRRALVAWILEQEAGA